MGRKVLLCGDETIGYIEHRLAPYIGTVAAEVADHRPLLGAVLQQYFTGASDVSIYDLLMGYRVPTDVANEIQRDITNELVRLINRAFACIYPTRTYQHFFVGEDDVLIEEINPLEVSEPLDNVESEIRTGREVVSSVLDRVPLNAMNGRNNSGWERQRRLHARLACHSAVGDVGDYEVQAVEQDPQFA